MKNKFRMFVSLLLIATFLVPTLGVLAMPAQNALHFRLQAGSGWVDSGVSVQAGEQTTIKAFGQAITAPINEFGQGTVSGPNGQVWNLGCGQYDGAPPPCAMDDAPYGALVGKIGTDGPPFLLGANSTFTAETSGALYLAVNDNLIYYSDNYGNFMVFFDH